MKIERKIILSNTVYLVLILIIGGFAVQSLNSVSGKQRFLEIADDLNTSFLTMRLAEKNYFLFNDNQALDLLDRLQDLPCHRTAGDQRRHQHGEERGE
ncbi:MAG: hypothetical protein M1539_00865, partial [Actinobacteria bacterium]|nr:hypothetical protein [Actinomycetota bacterium]